MNKKEHTNNDLINDHFPFPTEVHQFSLAVNDEFDTDTNVPTEMDQPAVNTLPDTLLPNPSSGLHSNSPLVTDTQLASEIQKPPDIDPPPFQQITRSMTKLGTAMTNINSKILVFLIETYLF